MIEWLRRSIGPTEAKLAASLLVVALLLVLRWAVLRALRGRVEDVAAWYRARKAAGYVTTVVAVLVLAAIWAAGFRDLATFLGLLSAGVAIALADLLKNIAGWVYIVLRRPFWLGDRIQVGEHAGDVVDVRLFRFSLLEIRNWVESDQSTGRIIHLPNGKVFTEPIANFTQGFEFIWHEIPVLITFESDWERAEAIFREVLRSVAPDVASRAGEAIRRAGRAFLIHYQHLDPTVYVSVRDSGVLLTGRLLVPARRRRSVDQDVWKGLLRAFAAEPQVELAYPTIRTYLPDPLRLEGEMPGSGRGTP